MTQKACKICHRLTEDKECPACKTKELTENCQGEILVLNPEKSEIAKELHFEAPGRYAVKV